MLAADTKERPRFIQSFNQYYSRSSLTNRVEAIENAPAWSHFSAFRGKFSTGFSTGLWKNRQNLKYRFKFLSINHLREKFMTETGRRLA